MTEPERETPPVLFAGDPHGNLTPILRACAALPAGDLILVGDIGCGKPFQELMAPASRAGWNVHWILGNHDTETEAAYDNLVNAPGDIGLRVVTIGGWRIGGLPGVFRPRVWEPEDGPAFFQSRSAFQASLPTGQLWRGGLPLWHRDTIFPEDFDRLGAAAFDILVTHEAPTSHRHGHAVIDDLAQRCGCRLIVHGHHHQSYEATLPNGIRVRGLGLSEVWRLDLVPS